MELAALANALEVKTDTFWPDCGHSMASDSPIKFPILDYRDIQKTISYIEEKIRSSQDLPTTSETH
jgi:hypothetical protein